MSKTFLQMLFTLTFVGFTVHSSPIFAQNEDTRFPSTYDATFPSSGLYISAQEISTSPAGTYDTAPIALGGPAPLNAPIGLTAPHYCSATYYLQSAIENGEEGSADVDFVIGKDGHTKNAVVTRSSGWRDIDHVAVECVAKWTYKPAIKNNEPVEASSKARIAVQINHGEDPRVVDAKITRPAPKRMTQCSIPGSNEKLQQPVVAMTVDTMGDVDDPAIEQSSGDPEADKIVLDCVKKWKFTPAMQFGRPLVVRTRGIVQLSQSATP
jgi:TonB family protein